MVFQWVDSPSYGRATHQQYLQAPQPSPYFQGLDAPHRGLDAMPLGQPHGLDPRAAPQAMDPNLALGHYPGQGLDATRYGPPGQDLGYNAQRLTLEQAAVAAQYGQRRDLQYGQGRPRLERPPHAMQVEDRLQYGQQALPGAKLGRRHPKAVESTGGGGGGSGARRGAEPTPGARRGAEPSPDAQTAAVLETLGPDGLRQTLISTLESLYEDRIKPMANYVKGRLKERSTPELIVKSFVELYAQHPDLFIVQQPPPGGQADEATIFFVQEPAWFKGWVDIDAPDDPYDEKTWEELAKFLDGEHTFAGGRYGMARELMQRNLQFLAALSLGEVCHMVQLAIQHRRLIVYHRKMLKPIQTVLCQLSPANGNGVVEQVSQGEEIKDMDDLCLVLFRMLIHHPQGIRLCRMKQMIKHEFCRKLSEMAFQCTKLIELFNQEPLAATFVLDTENDGKSIYVRLGNPETFTDHVKRIYAMASSAEAKQALQNS